MASTKKFPAPLTILMMIIVLAAIATWLVPAGRYNTLSYTAGSTNFILSSPGGEVPLPLTQHTIDSLHIRMGLEKFSAGDIRKPVSIPGTYHTLPRKRQGLISMLEAPVKGMYDTIDIVFFILVIGGFINIFYQSGAIEKGLAHLSKTMKGKETWLIIVLSFLFVLAGSTFGMAEEGLAFYPLLVPVFLMAGYDLLVPVAVIFMGNQIGFLSSVSNPFATIIASNAAGVSWTSGLYERIAMLLVSSAVSIWYTVRYAQKVKKDPAASLVLRYDGQVSPSFSTFGNTQAAAPGRKAALILLLFAFTFSVMVTGVVFFKWWLQEMSTLLIASSLILGLLLRMNEKVFIAQFIKGAEGLLGVAFIIGVARGVTIILNDGLISDTILYHSAKLVGSMPPAIFIVVLLLMYMLFTLFISSSSGMAVLTMPIMGSLAVVAAIPGQEVVNAYLYGMGIMGLVTPTGLILPSLALVHVSFKTWLKFVLPLMLMLLIICALFLVVGCL